MNGHLVVTSQDPILKTLDFKPYRDSAERQFFRFWPEPDESQILTINTPWGAQLTAKKGYFLIVDQNATDDVWPIAPEIFNESYILTRPGFCRKTVPTYLVPLTDLTEGDKNQLVTIHTLEGAEIVTAGEFYLAKGIKGEIWPYPKEKVGNVMMPAD